LRKPLSAALCLLVASSAVADDATTSASPCRPAEQRLVVSVTAMPEHEDMAGISIRLTYPAGAAALPGTGTDASVGARVVNLPADAISASHDFEDALTVAIVRKSAITAGELFRVEFDRCEGATAPSAAPFACTVESAAASNGAAMKATCAAAVVDGAGPPR
jgi:hypothetical protein